MGRYAHILTKREQFHSNIIGQSVTLYRDEVRQRISELTNYFMSHGIADPATAKNQAIVAIGNDVKRQALIMGFSDTFAVIGVVLSIAAVTLILGRRKPNPAAGAGPKKGLVQIIMKVHVPATTATPTPDPDPAWPLRGKITERVSMLRRRCGDFASLIRLLSA